METRKLRHFFVVGVVLAVSSVAFHIIAFASNGYFIRSNQNSTWNIGLWYLTKCDESGDCHTISRRDQYAGYDSSVFNLITYSYIVRWQVVNTIELCCSIICVVMFGIALYKHRYDRRIRIPILTCSFLSGILNIHHLGITLREQQLYIKYPENEEIVHFPWSLVMVFFAALLILSVSGLCLIIEWKMHQRRNPQQESAIEQVTAQYKQSRKQIILGIILTAVSIAFRIVAFSSNAWRITKEGHLTTFEGLWYQTICNQKGDCGTRSMKTYFETKYYRGLDNFDYSNQVRSQVVLTLSLLFSIVCLVLLIIEARKLFINIITRLSIMLCSLLSGTFWLYDIGQYIRIYVIDLEKNIVYFPWSLLFGLFGSVLILIISFIRIFKECAIEEIHDSELDNILPMDTTEDNERTDGEHRMSENGAQTDVVI